MSEHFHGDDYQTQQDNDAAVDASRARQNSLAALQAKLTQLGAAITSGGQAKDLLVQRITTLRTAWPGQPVAADAKRLADYAEGACKDMHNVIEFGKTIVVSGQTLHDQYLLKLGAVMQNPTAVTWTAEDTNQISSTTRSVTWMREVMTSFTAVSHTLRIMPPRGFDAFLEERGRSLAPDGDASWVPECIENIAAQKQSNPFWFALVTSGGAAVGVGALAAGYGLGAAEAGGGVAEGGLIARAALALGPLGAPVVAGLLSGLAIAGLVCACEKLANVRARQLQAHREGTVFAAIDRAKNLDSRDVVKYLKSVETVLRPVERRLFPRLDEPERCPICWADCGEGALMLVNADNDVCAKHFLCCNSANCRRAIRESHKCPQCRAAVANTHVARLTLNSTHANAPAQPEVQTAAAEAQRVKHPHERARGRKRREGRGVGVH